MTEEEKPDFITKVSKYLPSVMKPTFKQGFNAKLKWTGFALIMYLILSYIPIFGVSPSTYTQFRLYEIILGSRIGSLMTLGIGPIVTAGIILQLLVGSKILNWDTNKPEGRRKFQAWDKFLAIVFAIVEGAAYVLVGAIRTTGAPFAFTYVIGQLALGGILVILLDELVSKWGFGSGVSLFIAAGVGSQILIQAISPIGQGCGLSGTTIVPGISNFANCIPSVSNPPVGYFWQFMSGIFEKNSQLIIFNIVPIISTIAIFFVVVWAQNIRIDLPLSFSSMRGFGRTWSLRLFYTSNIPVILAAALLANLRLMAQYGVTPQANGLSCGFLGCLDANGNPASGLIYYLTSPASRTQGSILQDLLTGTLVTQELVRAVTYLIFLTTAAVIFSVFWISTSGMDAKSVANQISEIGMQIPGYRKDPKIMEAVLNKYIPPLAVLGGLAIGLLAALADFSGAIGTGTGILLTVTIIYNYYEQLTSEKLEDAHPLVKKVLGE